MAAIDWPTAYLPASPLWEQYGVEQDQGLIRTPMDSGWARQRRRYPSAPSTVTVRWLMTAPQIEFFKSWMASAAAGSFFNIELRLDAEPRTIDARFIASQKPRYVRAGSDGSWFVDAVLEVRDTPPLSSDVVELLLTFGADELIAAGADLQGVTLQPAFQAWWEGFAL